MLFKIMVSKKHIDPYSNLLCQGHTIPQGKGIATEKEREENKENKMKMGKRERKSCEEKRKNEGIGNEVNREVI